MASQPAFRYRGRAMRWGGIIWALFCLVGAVAAEDTGNKMRGRPKTLRTGEWSADYGTYHALLIGVDNYAASEKFNDLGNAVNDVNSLETHLVDVLKWPRDNVTVLRNTEVTREAVQAALEVYGSSLGPRDNLLIWFAGHGTVTAGSGGSWFWIMHDGKNLRYDGGISSLLRGVDSKHLLLVSDSCYAAVSGVDPSGTPDPAEVQRFNATRSRQIITSGDGQPVGDQGEYKSTGNRSEFAGAFLQALRDMDATTPPRTAWQIFKAAQMRTLQTSEGKQTPRCAFLRDDAPSHAGQFIFVHPGFLADDAERNKAFLTEQISHTRYEKGYAIRRDGGLNTLVYTHDDIRRDRDPNPMVLVKHTLLRRTGGTEVPLRPFLIDMREVTVGQFKSFLAGNDRRGTRYLTEPNYGDDNQPVVGVTLAQAAAYAHWAGKELPDENQWFAAAALAWNDSKKEWKRHKYTWSTSRPGLEEKLAWTAFPPPVHADTKDISPWGVQRMGSGVREWCRLAGVRDLSRGVIRGGTVVRASGRDTKATWTSRARLPSDGRIARSNVGFRCIYQLRPVSGGDG